MNASIPAALTALLLVSPGSLFAQDAVKADPAHYKVEFENDQVRVLRVRYGPGEKSPMHSHPNHVFVFLSDGRMKFTHPDGKTVDGGQTKAGTTGWANTDLTHAPENVGSQPIELILVETKTPRDK